MDLAALRLLVVNAGSTSLKLHVVEGVESRAVESLEGDVDGVAHRVVHGGERFRDPVVVDDAVRAEIQALTAIAPLHNAPALRGLDDARAVLPDVPHVAVFDTAFHATIPAEAATYAIPRAWRERGIRRFGFHGLSVEWVAEQVPVPRLVVCHLGGGCSVTAVRDGRSVDTTMGFTPLEGVPMATRAGSLDPGALVHLLREGLSVADLDRALNESSGIAALGGLEEPLALAVFTHRVAGAVAATATACGGLDALVFTGGIGENVPAVRAEVCSRLAFMLAGVDVRVVAAREELVAARHARRVLA